MYLDKQHPRPVYLQLKELLQNKIEQGIYLAHQQLPSERDLCQHHNLSRMTARRALQELISEGFAYTRAGKGTFVSNNPNLNNKFKDEPNYISTSNLDGNLSVAYLQHKLMPLLLSFDCVGLEQAISETLATHSLEIIASKLFLGTIRQFEQKWLNGEVSLLVHNYAVTTLRSQLIAMMNAAAMSETGPKILLACAPGDQHELGLLVLALSLRRRGFLVIYLGPNLSASEFHRVLDIVQPRLICLAAATAQSAKNLLALGQQCQNRLVIEKANYKISKPKQESLLTFGGVIFNLNPVLISNTPGIYLGNTIEDAVTKIQELVM
jgi:DNA-binding transcriptional regulator YhcF (GntR family)